MLKGANLKGGGGQRWPAATGQKAKNSIKQTMM